MNFARGEESEFVRGVRVVKCRPFVDAMVELTAALLNTEDAALDELAEPRAWRMSPEHGSPSSVEELLSSSL